MTESKICAKLTKKKANSRNIFKAFYPKLIVRYAEFVDLVESVKGKCEIYQI